MDISNAFDIIKDKLQKDFMYAWGWHCNIAVCSQDEGMDHVSSNKAAARFMKICFDVDTTQDAFDRNMKTNENR